MRQSTQRKSSIHDLGNGDLGAILASVLGGGPDLSEGKPIAKGVDAIMASLADIGKQKSSSGMPQGIMDDLKAKLDGVHDAVLYEMPDGSHVIAGTAIDVVGGFDGLDMETLASAMRFSDRHGGKSASDHFFGFEPKGGGLGDALRARLREAQERMRSPIDTFMRTSKEAMKGPPREKESSAPSPTMSIMLAATTTAVELTRYARRQTDAPVAVVEAMVKLITDIQITDATRFGNLDGHLIGYGVHLGAIIEKLRQFTHKPRVDTAEDLAKSLALMMPIMVNVMRDAADNAEKAAKDAMAI